MGIPAISAIADRGVGMGEVEKQDTHLISLARRTGWNCEKIAYGLYQNPQRNQHWGDTEGATAQGTGSGVIQSHTVYARIGPQSVPSPGTYTDTVVVIVDY